jgi:ribosomal protein S27E
MPGAVPPARYFEALKKSQATSSIHEIAPEVMLLYKLENLKKSLNDYFGAFTSMRCSHCGHAIRFFKSGSIPNGCSSCGEHFSITDIWKSLNK